MIRICKLTILFFLLLLPFSSYAHVQHYEKLNKIEFNIYRNNKNIGKHIFSFKKENEQLIVDSEIYFEIKKFGVVLYKYNVKGTEIYKNNMLTKFNSKTNANGKEKYVNIKEENKELIIDGSSYKGKAPVEYLIGTWWNHSIVKAEAQISAVSGRIIKQKVTFLGEEVLVINGKEYKALHFNFSSSDQSLKKNKKLNTDIWYDKENLNWIKATFNKSGAWEYKLISIN